GNLPPAPPVPLAGRVEVLPRVQRPVLAGGVLPQLGEDRLRVVAQRAVARCPRRRPPLVFAAQRLVQRRDQRRAVFRLDLLHVLGQRVRLAYLAAGLPRGVVRRGDQAGERVSRVCPPGDVSPAVGPVGGVHAHRIAP